MLHYKQDFERAQKYWDAFWNKQIIDRPCAVVFAKKDPRAEIPRFTIPVEEPFQTAFEKFDNFLMSYEFLGEAMPGFRPDFGPDQMAGFLGAPVIMDNPETGTSWSNKIVDKWENFLPLKIDNQNQCWKRMIEFHKQAQQYYKDKCLLYNIDLHSNIDAIEGLRGAENLLFDIIDSPELVSKAMDDVRKLYTKVYDTFYCYGNKQQIGTCSWLHFYSRNKFNPIQADFICLLSPDMFRKFVLPAIEEEAQYLDNSCFHLDGKDSLKHIDDILAIKEIDAVQWVPGAGAKPQLEWPEVLHKIQNAGKAVILYGSIEQIKAIHGKYKSELVVYQVQADSVEKGKEFLDWLCSNT